MKTKILFFLFFIQGSAFALINPGPDGVRFNKIEIYRIESSLKAKLADKENLSPEETIELKNLQTILASGKRAITWFEKINASRSAENKMDLSVKGSSKGMPITDPMKTNSQILFERYNKILNEISPLITSVVTESGDLPENAPLDDPEFVKAIRALDVVYQHTIRWIGSKDSLGWFITRSIWDVRGFIFLQKTADLENKLAEWNSLSEDLKTNLKASLLGICHNGHFGESECQAQLENSISKNDVLNYYNRYKQFGEFRYKSFFEIPRTRPEVYWNADKTTLYSPFLTPEREDVKKWLKGNIEEEWKGSDFNLVLDFKEQSRAVIPHINFQSGITANVNQIAGDTITMDADYSLQNYDQRWTIRHEYGHVLGLVDCYLEFYDVNEKAMIYYEIDIDNIMCSRHGNLLPSHITALKSAYK